MIQVTHEHLLNSPIQQDWTGTPSENEPQPAPKLEVPFPLKHNNPPKKETVALWFPFSKQKPTT